MLYLECIWPTVLPCTVTRKPSRIYCWPKKIGILTSDAVINMLQELLVPDLVVYASFIMGSVCSVLAAITTSLAMIRQISVVLVCYSHFYSLISNLINHCHLISSWNLIQWRKDQISVSRLCHSLLHKMFVFMCLLYVMHIVTITDFQFGFESHRNVCVLRFVRRTQHPNESMTSQPAAG